MVISAIKNEAYHRFDLSIFDKKSNVIELLLLREEPEGLQLKMPCGQVPEVQSSQDMFYL